MYYNRTVLCGRVPDDPVIRTSKSGKNFVTLRLGVKHGNSKTEYDNFNLTAYGEMGNSILEKVHGGDFICVSGPVSGSAYTSAKGKSGVNLQVIVLKWEMDPTTVMTREMEREAHEGTAAAEEEINEEFLF